MDLSNKRFGRLVALYSIKKNGVEYWHCRCDCGNEKDIYKHSLTSGLTKSCGCLSKETTHKNKFKDLAGQRFGKLVVIEFIGFDTKQNMSMYKCRCDCGNEVVVARSALKSGHTQSCGCIAKDRRRERLDALLNKSYGDLFAESVEDYTARRVFITLSCKEGHKIRCREDNLKKINKCPICEKIIKYKEKFIGKVYDIVTVVDLNRYDEKLGMCYWNCKTKDNLIIVLSTDELEKYKKINHNRIVNIGDRFGKLEVTNIFIKDNKTYCSCLCDCGNTIDILKSNIYSRKSCGCSLKDKILHLEGNRFGRWTVKEYNKDKHKWLCVCDCGNEGYVTTGDLTSSHSQSCGCLSAELITKRQRKNLIGEKFGKLTVIDRVIHDDGKVGKYKCLCECGRITYVTSNNLIQGNVRSCGCLQVNINGSKAENDIKDFVENISDKEFKKVKILDGKEIDMYNEELKLGIEYNGSYFHASMNCAYKNKPKDYHRDKFLLAKERGIHLINIFDVDWQNNGDRIRNYLKYLLTKQERIFARNCYIQEISKNTAKDFIDKYHLQGFSQMCGINYGLYYNNELVSVMSFGKLRMSKTEGQYELYHYCVKDGYTVVGGASKLFKYFVNNYNPKYIRSYSDNDYFLGNLYSVLGFDCSGQVNQKYYWVKSGRAFKEEQCQLKYLKKQYPAEYERALELGVPNKEDYIMGELGSQKVYRSGNTKWEWHPTEQ